MAYSPASSSFPTSKTTFSDPATTSDTNDFDHAGLESTQNDAIEKLEDQVGIDGSSDTDTLEYRLANASSSDPGHTHTTSSLPVKDEDDMSSDSASDVPTQQSVKAYVDTQLTAEDLDVSANTGTIDIDLDSETLAIDGGTGIDTTAASAQVQIAIDSTVATLTGSQTLTNKTLTTPAIGDYTSATHDHSNAAGGGNITAAAVSDFDTEVSNNVNVASATTHITATGADHSYIDQDVTSGSSPTLDGANFSGITMSKAITVEEPTDSEDISMFFTPEAITITEMRAVLRGSSTPSVTWTVRHHATDRSNAGNEVVTGGTTTTSTTSGSDVTSFNDATIPADSFVWLESTAQSGTVDTIHLTVVYDKD